MMNRPAVMLLEGWAGCTEHAVLVIGETRTRYRVKALQRTPLAGRARTLEAGQTMLVPKYAVAFRTAKVTT